MHNSFLEFEVKDLDPSRYLLGMDERIYISQRKYTLDLLKQTGMLGNKSADMPLDGSTQENWVQRGLLFTMLPRLLARL